MLRFLRLTSLVALVLTLGMGTALAAKKSRKAVETAPEVAIENEAMPAAGKGAGDVKVSEAVQQKEVQKKDVQKLDNDKPIPLFPKLDAKASIDAADLEEAPLTTRAYKEAKDAQKKAERLSKKSSGKSALTVKASTEDATENQAEMKVQPEAQQPEMKSAANTPVEQVQENTAKPVEVKKEGSVVKGIKKLLSVKKSAPQQEAEAPEQPQPQQDAPNAPKQQEASKAEPKNQKLGKKATLEVLKPQAQAANAAEDNVKSELTAVAPAGITEQAQAGETGLNVLEFVLANEIVNREPKNVTENFEGNDRGFAFARLQAQTPTEVTFVWTRDGKEHNRYKTQVQQAKMWRTFSYVKLRPGNWQVKLLGKNDEVLAEKSFTIQ